ncbi:MAG: toll/interleukin-1 receptor domain-containing protein [Armatimonadetes bacterium]|nr:toll/interleukin-1 receptor domain-containing protein [Armatimonadota bacterium]
MDEPLRVFISYDRSDGHEAACIKACLEAEGFTCFLAHEDLEVSSVWRERIWEELTGCDCFVGLISEASNASVWCQQETAVALCRLPPERFVLVKLGAADPQGFAARYQAIPVGRLLPALDSCPFVRENRINAMIGRLKEANTYSQARERGRQLVGLIPTLTREQVARLLRVSLQNDQVWNEEYGIGPRVRELYAAYEEQHGEDAARALRWTPHPSDSPG